MFFAAVQDPIFSTSSVDKSVHKQRNLQPMPRHYTTCFKL